MELGGEVVAHNLTLSGAEYEILLTAANAAGKGPARQLHVPADQHTGTGPAEGPSSPAALRGYFPSLPSHPPPPHFIPDLSFKDISTAGSTVSAWWEAPSPGSAYCFEQQPLLGALNEGACKQHNFPAKSIHMERGKGDPPQAPRPSPLPGARSWGSSTSIPGSCPRSTGSAGVLPPRCARPGPGKGLVNLRPAAPLRWQRYVWKHGAPAPDLTAKRVGVCPKTVPRVVFFCTSTSPSHAASLAVPIRINASAKDATAAVLWWSPSPRAACPGALAKYLICHMAEGDNMTCEWGPPRPHGAGRGHCLQPATACSLSFAQMVKRTPRHRTTRSKTYGPAQRTGWAFGR